MLTLQAHEKEVEITTPEKFIRGTVGANCQVNFDEFWKDYAKTVVFKKIGCKPINIMVDSLINTIEIPHIILAESCDFKIGVFGVTPTETLPTLYSDDIKILYGTDTHGTAPHPYTPSEIDQLRLSKQDKLTAGDGITIDENNVISATGGGGSGGTTDYELLENKPQINGVELLGNKSLSELGINIPTKTSDLENDSGFIDDTAFENYYTKTEVDEKTVVDQTYDKNSQNAQSGKAVSQAVSQAVIYRTPKIILGVSPPFPQVVSIKSRPELETYDNYNKPYPKDTAYTHLKVDDGYSKTQSTIKEVKGFIATRDISTGNLWTGTPIDNEDCINKQYLDEASTTTPTADKIPKYNQYGQLIVNCTEYEPGTETAKVYSGESVPRDLWKAYINNFHQRITNLDNITAGIDRLFDKKISFQYATTDTEVILKSNCLYFVIDHSGANNTNVYVTKSDDTKVVATTQGDSAVENFPAFRLSLIIVPNDYYHTMVIGQTGKFSLTNFSPLYTKQVIWDNTYQNMFIKTTGTGMSIWKINI